MNIGIIIDSTHKNLESTYFCKCAKEMGVKLVFFNTAEEINEDELQSKAKLCNIIYNDSGTILSLELAKTLEEMGAYVVEPSKVAYYVEEKWMTHLKLEKHNIPMPKTILLPADLRAVKSELVKFNQWPVILKRVYGERGDFVRKADNLNQAIKEYKDLAYLGKDIYPVLAQEFVLSDSYRVTMIDGKIVQTAIKRRHHGWKATGCHDVRFSHFHIPPSLANLSHKIAKICGIEILGIDYAKTDKGWLLIEVNSDPSLKFFNTEHKEMVEKSLHGLCHLAYKHQNKLK
jgi:glutathione synthase/RimK-type ligase-like ATP-grasp enzyme